MQVGVGELTLANVCGVGVGAGEKRGQRLFASSAVALYVGGFDGFWGRSGRCGSNIPCGIGDYGRNPRM